MTYIAAFHCRDGIVMCADTQETEGEYKNYVEKLVIVEDRSYPLAVGGAGAGELIDAMTQEIIQRARENKPKTKAELITLVKIALTEVYEKDVPTLVLPKQYRSPQLVVAAKPGNDSFCILVSRGRRILGEQKSAIIGYPTAYNRDLLSRLHRESLPMSQAAILGVYLVSQSKKFDAGVGGRTSIAVIVSGGAYIDDPEDITVLENRAAEVGSLTDELFLACTDVGMSKKDFDEKIDSFVSKAREIRSKYVAYAGERAFKKLANNQPIDDPYPKFPPGGSVTISIGDGRLGFEASDEAQPPEFVRKFIEEEEARKRKSKPSASEKSEPEKEKA